MRATYGNVDGWSLDASRCASVSRTSPPHAVNDGEFDHGDHVRVREDVAAERAGPRVLRGVEVDEEQLELVGRGAQRGGVGTFQKVRQIVAELARHHSLKLDCGFDGIVRVSARRRVGDSPGVVPAHQPDEHAADDLEHDPEGGAHDVDGDVEELHEDWA